MKSPADQKTDGAMNYAALSALATTFRAVHRMQSSQPL